MTAAFAMSQRRPIAVAVLVALAGVISLNPARADAPSVPLQLQVELSNKVIEYVQQPPISSLDRIRIGIVVKTSSPDSTRAGAELKAAFDRVVMAGGRPHDQSIIEWSSATALAEQTRSRSLSVLYFTPGLDVEIAASAAALVGRRTITIAAVDSFVASGIVLGFELVSGHPKMVFNLRQAKKQEVVLRAAVMKLMRIVE
jgi:hypothetical protein